MKLRTICVYCGSNRGENPVYREVATQVGASLAQRGIRIVYGAGHVGLMGVVADAALAAGGEVVGVIPRALADWEVAHTGLTELHLVENMHERKAMMADFSDAFLALPGGFGTLEELFEVLTWSQLRIHSKPCGILNVNGFFDPLFVFLEHMVQEGFLRTQHRELALFHTDLDVLLAALEDFEPPVVEKWWDRSLR
ncbi:MAG: TIGR00730 family Rossman fold protein [Armatimonadaceae bacterium]